MAFYIFSRPSSSALLLFSLACKVTNAHPRHEPTKTATYQGVDWSPRITSVPSNPKDFLRRSHLGVEVCGWIGGNLASPVACGTGSACVHDTIHGYVGCCATSGPCTVGVNTDCIDESSWKWTGEFGPVNNGVTTCASGQACYRNKYPGGYRQYNCGSWHLATTVETSYSGQPKGVSLQVVYTGVVFLPMGAPVATDSSSSSSEGLTSRTPLSTISSSKTLALLSSTTSSSISHSFSTLSRASRTASKAAELASTTTTAAVQSSASDTKVIVGGVVGGLAFLTVIFGVLLFLLQKRLAQRNRDRVGSSVGQLKDGQSHPIEPVQRHAPYIPNDFGSSMTERPRETPSTIAAAFPNNHLTLSLPDMPAVFLASTRREETRADNVRSASSEIDDFARAYNEATRHHQSRIRETTRTTEFVFENPGFETPIFAPQHAFATGADLEPLDIPMWGCGTLTPSHEGGGRSGRDRERDKLMDEDKEDNGGGGLSRSFAANVREEGWSPQGLRLSPPRKKGSLSGMQRYQLVDDVPKGTVPVLHSPGQLRASRMARGRDSP